MTMTSLILRLIEEFCIYLLEVEQLSLNSVNNIRGRLMHFVDWLGEASILDAPHRHPGFAEYLKSARRDGWGRPLSHYYSVRVVRSVKRFLKWLMAHHEGFDSVSPAWIGSLKPPRSTIESPSPKAVLFERILEIAKAPAEQLWEKRIQAAVCFMFLSGIRVGAFVTLRPLTIEMESLTVKQLPSLGVRTKNSKAAITYLLNIEETLDDESLMPDCLS